MKSYLVFVSMGFEIVGLIVGSYMLGSALDKKYQTGGLIFVGLSLFCLVGWLVRVIWLLKKMEQNESKDKN